MNEHEMRSLVIAIATATYNSYSATLIGPQIPIVRELHRRFEDLRPGDLVVEISKRPPA